MLLCRFASSKTWTNTGDVNKNYVRDIFNNICLWEFRVQLTLNPDNSELNLLLIALVCEGCRNKVP